MSSSSYGTQPTRFASRSEELTQAALKKQDPAGAFGFADRPSKPYPRGEAQIVNEHYRPLLVERFDSPQEAVYPTQIAREMDRECVSRQWCSERRSKIICVETGIPFASAADVAAMFEVSVAAVHKAAAKKTELAGFHWEYAT